MQNANGSSAPSTTKRGAPDHFGQILVPARQRVRVIAISADPRPDQVPALGPGTAFRVQGLRQEGSPASGRIFTGRAPRLWRWAIAEVSVRLSTARHLAMGFMELLLFIFGHCTVNTN
jgi:hypothetical protein